MTSPGKTGTRCASSPSLCRTVIVLALILASATFPTDATQADSQAEIHAAKASRLIQAGNPQGAEAELRRAVALVPDNPSYLAKLGQVLGMQQRMEEAAEYYEKALALAPNNVIIRRNLALTQWSRRQFQEARTNMEQVLAIRPNDEPTRFLLGMILVNSGEYARAVGLLESVPERVRGQGEAVAALARAQYALGKKDQARATLESMALNRSLSPGDVYACATTAANAEDFVTAEKLFLSIRSTYPDAAALSYQIALMQFRSDSIDRSRQTLLEAIDKGQRSGPIYNLLGHCHAAQNRLQSAVASFEQAIELEPAEESHYLDAVQLLAEHQIWRVLIRIAEKGVARIPRSDRLFRMKGLAETAMLYSEDAVRSYRRALEINPDSAKTNLGDGYSPANSGKSGGCRRHLRKGYPEVPRPRSPLSGIWPDAPQSRRDRGRQRPGTSHCPTAESRRTGCLSSRSALPARSAGLGEGSGRRGAPPSGNRRQAEPRSEQGSLSAGAGLSPPGAGRAGAVPFEDLSSDEGGRGVQARA